MSDYFRYSRPRRTALQHNILDTAFPHFGHPCAEQFYGVFQVLSFNFSRLSSFQLPQSGLPPFRTPPSLILDTLVQNSLNHFSHYRPQNTQKEHKNTFFHHRVHREHRGKIGVSEWMQPLPAFIR